VCGIGRCLGSQLDVTCVPLESTGRPELAQGKGLGLQLVAEATVGEPVGGVWHVPSDVHREAAAVAAAVVLCSSVAGAWGCCAVLRCSEYAHTVRGTWIPSLRAPAPEGTKVCSASCSEQPCGQPVGRHAGCAALLPALWML
jgi:hypothetical protein